MNVTEAGKLIRKKIKSYIKKGGEVDRGTWGPEIVALSREILVDGDVQAEVYDIAVVPDDATSCALGALLFETKLSSKQRERIIESGDFSPEHVAAVATGMSPQQVKQFISGFDDGDRSTPWARLGDDIAAEFCGEPDHDDDDIGGLCDNRDCMVCY